jgi:hypothetical protein
VDHSGASPRWTLDRGLVMTSLELILSAAPGHDSSPVMAHRREEHGESVSGLTVAWAAMWQPGDVGEEVAMEALGAGSAWAWREEKDGERCGGGWVMTIGEGSAQPGSRGGEAVGC